MEKMIARQNRVWKLIHPVAAGVVTLLLATSATAQVVIGQVLPLSGVLENTGKQMALGVKLYIDHVNSQGGINGQKLKHVVIDDAYKLEETVAQTKALIERDRPVALIGYAGTANIGELLKQKVLENANMPLVAPYTGGEPLRNPFNPWIFHIRAGYADETAHMVDHLATLGIKRVAVFYQDDAFGRSGLAGVETAAAKYGTQIVAKGTYDRLTGNMGDAVQQIAKAQPNAVITVATSKPLGNFIKGYRDVGGAGMLMSISVVDPGDVAKIAGMSNVRGLAITQPVPYPYSGVSPLVKEFNEVFKKHAPEGTAITYAVFEEYIGAKVLVEGIKRAGKNPTSEKVLQSLASVGRLELGGFSVNFSSNNRIGSRYVDIVVVGAEGKLLK